MEAVATYYTGLNWKRPLLAEHCRRFNEGSRGDGIKMVKTI